MKNQIFIEVDTEKTDKPFIISKPMEYQPSNAEEAKAGIINDISCVCEALCRLIITADNSGYAKREDLVKASISLLNGVIPVTSENTQG